MNPPSEPRDPVIYLDEVCVLILLPNAGSGAVAALDAKNWPPRIKNGRQEAQDGRQEAYMLYLNMCCAALRKIESSCCLQIHWL